ncbi:hypothetical protein ACILE9_04470 [Capnocytophaga cynodegmi]|uniref:hypothetical protein n=1 Tax=Capnocytophaga cynodegmi TaxID=28189 RepID=UPI0037D6E2CF
MKNILRMSFMAVVFLVVSCGKSENKEEEIIHFPEVSNSLNDIKVKLGETFQIQGTGFSKDKEYVVTFEPNQKGKIIEITDKYLKVEVPQNAISGEITLTFNGKTKVVGTIIIQKEYELYAYRRDYTDMNNYLKQLVKIDVNTGNQTVVSNLEFEGAYFTDLIFSENERNIIGFIATPSNGTALLKVNIDTGKSKTVLLSDEQSISFNYLVKDDKGDMYAYRRDNVDMDNYLKQLVKIDASTGNQTIVSSLEFEGTYFEDLVFDEKEKTIMGFTTTLSGGRSLLKVNMNTGKSTTTLLSDKQGINFDYLVKDDKGYIYAYRRDYTDMNNYLKQLVKIDKNTGNQTIVSNLDIEGTYFTDLVFDEEEKDIMGLTTTPSGSKILLKVNVNTGKNTKILLSDKKEISFNDLIFIPKK